MRSSLLIALLSFLTLFPQKTDIWQHVPIEPASRPKTATPSPTQLVIIRKALKAREELDVEGCGDEEPNWVDKVLFKEFPISETEKALLIEAGEGCARGGQGSNGAMWVVRFEGDKLSFLATPEQQFEGWLYSIQPTTSHGLRDLVLGWHMNAAETGLSYFRFDGSSYHSVATAVLVYGEDGAKIVPNESCQTNIRKRSVCPQFHSSPHDLYETYSAVHIRVGLSRRFCELAVFDARLYVRVRRVDQPA
jgi:hypothetical protein